MAHVPDAPLTAGSATVDITPPLTIPELGFFNARHTFFRGVHDPLHARAVVVDDGDDRVALVMVDAIGVTRRAFGEGRDFIAEARERAARMTGISPDHIMIAATHAHSTPETLGARPLTSHPGAAEWLEVFADKLASAVALADRAREPARIKQAAGRADGVGWCRRIIGKDGRIHSYGERPPDDEIADWGTNDPLVTVLCLETLDGRPKTALVHFTCHPVTVQVNELVSADYPGAAIAHVERAGIGCEHCMFVQGACGNINPVRNTSGFGDVALYGQILGAEAVKLLGLAAASDYPAASSRVAAATAHVQIASRELPDLAELERERAAREQEAAKNDTQRAAAQNAVQVLEEHIARAELGAGPFEAEVQVLRIGGMAFVGISVEPFVEVGLAIRGISDTLTCVCVGYANDYLGYVGPPEAWDQGGYEFSLGMWAILGREAFGRILGAAKEVVVKMGG
jgi:hypothetical protein